MIIILYLFLPCICSGSLFTNSNWFAFEDENSINQRSTRSAAFPSPEAEGTEVADQGADREIILHGNDDLVDSTSSENPEAKPAKEDSKSDVSSEDCLENESKECDKSTESVEWTESSDIVESSCQAPDAGNESDAVKPSSLVNGGLEMEFGAPVDDVNPKNITDSSPSIDVATSDEKNESDDVNPKNITEASPSIDVTTSDEKNEEYRTT